jgi:hypothetical protein
MLRSPYISKLSVERKKGKVEDWYKLTSDFIFTVKTAYYRNGTG